jgi:hypothetical protein
VIGCPISSFCRPRTFCPPPEPPKERVTHVTSLVGQNIWPRALRTSPRRAWLWPFLALPAVDEGHEGFWSYFHASATKQASAASRFGLGAMTRMEALTSAFAGIHASPRMEELDRKEVAGRMASVLRPTGPRDPTVLAGTRGLTTSRCVGEHTFHCERRIRCAA